jgi:hypothetical protein
MNIVTGESPENVARRCFIHLWPQCSLFFEELHQPGLPFISNPLFSLMNSGTALAPRSTSDSLRSESWMRRSATPQTEAD